MNKKSLNTICFIVSVILFVIGLIISYGSLHSTNMTNAFIGVSWMIIGGLGFLYILQLFNRPE